MTDAELIRQLGGPTRLAEKLGWQQKRGAIQRINNWRVRGIPAAVKLAHPNLFLPMGWPTQHSDAPLQAVTPRGVGDA